MGPPSILECSVEPEWIDYNGHMNVAYYVLVFDRAIDEFLDGLGMDAGYREASGCTIYTLELHVSYLRELKLHDQLRIDCRVVDFDAKRVHCFLTLFHADSDEPAATMEQLFMHMDARAVKATAMPQRVMRALATLNAESARLPVPAQLGARIGIRRR